MFRKQKKKSLHFNTCVALAGNSGRLTRVRLQQPQEQRYLPIPTSSCSIFVCPNSGIYCCQRLGFLTSAQMLYGGCTDTVRESALNVDSRRKILCRTGDSNPRLALQTHALPTEPVRPALITSQKLCGQEGGPGFSFPLPFFPRHK